MRLFHTSCAVMIVLMVLGLGSISPGAEQDKKPPDKGVMHTIDARVTYSSGTSAGTNVLAERQPGFFKVPAGQVARNFKYYFTDPKSGIERDKLNDYTIYCETTKQWVKIPADPSTLELPPGDYKFVVGGTPGASGTLSFRTFASTGVAPPPASGDKRPPPTIREPPPNETTKTGVKPDSLHSGGEGQRRATVFKKGTRVFTDSAVKDPHFEGPVDAVLTIVEDSFTLEFPLATKVPNIRTFSETWKGRIAKQGQTLSVSGTVQENIIYTSGGYVKGPGTFRGTFDGARWSGTMEKKGDWDGGWGDGPKPFRETAEWSIKGLGN